MGRSFTAFWSIVIFLLLAVAAPAQAPKPPTKLPVDGYNIPLNLSRWDKAFTVLKVTYDKDVNEIVFLLKTKPDFASNAGTGFGFFDAHDVNLVDAENIKFTPTLDQVTAGENTRCHLALPDEDVLKKTKRVAAR